MSEFVNSAVSDSAVSRAEVEIQKNEVYVGAVPEATPDEVFIGQTADTVVLPEQKVEALQETLAKADALVESFEQRQAKLTEVYDQAEKMLEEVSRIKEALTFDNKLRERIEATIARTKNLRRGVQR
jgi:predicted nuclease with TOPRIM domain